MEIFSPTKKVLGKRAREYLVLVPKKLTRDLWLPAPSDNFTKWSSVRANVSNFIPDRKSGCILKIGGPENMAHQKELSDKIFLEFLSCKRLCIDGLTFLSYPKQESRCDHPRG